MANIRHQAHTQDFFYPLDNSAVFIASTTRRAAPYMYRVSCELDEPVYLPDLETALGRVIDRYPFLKTELRPGAFWYYLDPLKKPLHVCADTRYPGEYHNIGRWGRYLFRIRVYHTRVSCEFHHILTDGTGALEFLKSFLATYLTLRGVECADWEGIKSATSAIDPAEFDDAYADISRKDVPLPERLPDAFHLPGRRFSGLGYRVTTGTMQVADVLRVAREKGVTLTELLASVHLASLQAVSEAHSTRNFSPICIQIPVNMRKYFPTATLRNFFLFIPVSIDRRLGHFEFAEILERVHHLFRLNLARKELDRQIRRNVRGEKYIWSRIVPLFVKNITLRLIGRFKADKPFSGNLSNLQTITMPAAFAAHIRRFDVLPSRKTSIGANICIINWKDILSVTVGSLLVDRAFEREFFTRCAGLGIPLTVEANM